LHNIDSTALQESLRHLDRAFVNFFSSISGERKGRHIDFPRFKSLHKTLRYMSIINTNKSIRVQQVDEHYELKLNTLGYFRIYSWSSELKKVYDAERILSARIYQDSNQHWYVSLTVECEIQTEQPVEIRTTGIDLGLKTTVVLADGRVEDALKPTEKFSIKLKLLQRRAAHKYELCKKRNLRDERNQLIISNKLIKLYKRIGKLHFKIKCIRKDFNHKVSRYIVDNFEIITMEDLQIQQMCKNNSDLARKILDVAWFQLRTFIQYKCEWAGKTFLLASKWLPSSKTCSNCGQLVDLKLSMREWRCPTCNSIHDRDVNAAINLDRISRVYHETKVKITSRDSFLNSFA